MPLGKLAREEWINEYLTRGPIWNSVWNWEKIPIKYINWKIRNNYRKLLPTLDTNECISLEGKWITFIFHLCTYLWSVLPPPSNINQNFLSIADHVLLVTFANLSRNCPCTDIIYVFMHGLLLKGHSHSFAQILFSFFIVYYAL